MTIDIVFEIKIAKAIQNLPSFFVTGFEIMEDLGLEETPENIDLIKGYLCILKDEGCVEETNTAYRLTSKGYDFAYSEVI